MPLASVTPLRAFDPDGVEERRSSSTLFEHSVVGFDKRLRIINATAFEAHIIVDDDRRYVRVNEAATRVLGAAAGEIIGKRLEDFTPREYWPQLERLWIQFRRDGKLEGPYEVLQGNGSRQPIAFRADWHYAPGEHLIVAIEAPFAQPSPLEGQRLTKREREILQLVAAGLPNDEIARRLVVSQSTIKSHLQNIYLKLEVHDRAGAVAVALRSQLIE